MLLEQAFNQIRENRPLLVLDLCGAPGGKSTHLLSLLRKDDLLVSNEVIRSRAHILQESIQKWGHANVVVTNNDPREFATLPGLFDVVVVDAPCSGEGLFRKDQAAMGEWSVNNTRLCTSRQRRILADAWEALTPGGYLIYSTCTFNPDENEKNLHWMSQEVGGESVAMHHHPEWNLHEIRYLDILGYQTFPHLTRAEGFFTSILRKPGSPDSPLKKQKKQLKKWVPVPAGISGKLLPLLVHAASDDFLMKGELCYFFPPMWHTVLTVLEKYLNILQVGTPVASLKGTNINPHPALALSGKLANDFFPAVDLSLHEAVGFLRRDNLVLPGSPSGWILAAYRGTAMGWMKNLGGRTNNYFPKEWRIRMTVGDIPVPWHELPLQG